MVRLGFRILGIGFAVAAVVVVGSFELSSVEVFE